ncbi:transmembrane 9 superfamily member 11 isoform X2 [Physcomitrium patens]|uniref:transmembrane 9 superfamily member 11 isoform X2 n=1 Tax=Physcomitrium patens TaxID=3218 RepID=UPI000D16EBA6|nr:transmembrane 9 superfamily member 11-like [Physcomitrium patens]|eukprot:XP_024374433.1 transmembrane 9 superfamily member 11-like [Physcomitrella patens]
MATSMPLRPARLCSRLVSSSSVREGPCIFCPLASWSCGTTLIRGGGGAMDLKVRVGVLLVSFLVMLFPPVQAFYLPGTYLHPYKKGDKLEVKVNSLTSIETELPYSYYSLPFCKPPEGIQKMAENIGEMLMGDQIENSPYKFQMKVDQKDLLACVAPPLTENDVKHFNQRIDDLYQVHLILDNLPVTRLTTAAKEPNSQLRWTWSPIGFKFDDKPEHFIYNHLEFKVLVHPYDKDSASGAVLGTGEGLDTMPAATMQNLTGTYMVVGFEVAPCSVVRDAKAAKELKYQGLLPASDCDPNKPHQVIKVGEEIVYSYDVVFEESNIRWPSRWDAYLKMEGARVHWFSILNSLMVISFLAGIVFVIFLRTVRRDLTKYEDLDKEAQAQMNEELSGWKLVVGDVFRAPENPQLLCVVVGDGVQILGMAVVTILFAAMGFMSPASRGMLLTGMVLLYMFLGIIAGYVASRMWCTLKGVRDGWRPIAWKTACFFPGIAFTIMTVLNFLLWSRDSTGAIPISLYFVLLLLWFTISVPLTLLGGYLGAKAEPISFPVRTNQIPREIPPQRYPSWLLVLGAGTLPFGTLFIELFFIMSSIWMGRVYYVFGFLFVVLILLVIVCAEVSVVLTYMHLCVEDHKWWWKSFFASGSVSLYVFLYSINYLVFDLHSLAGPVSAALYLGYSLLMVITIMFATGTVGFLTSFYFVHFLFSSVKID